MIIKYCGKCFGNPYTTDINEKKCPICNGTLKIESVDDFELDGREKLKFSSDTETKENDVSIFPADFSNDFVSDEADIERDTYKNQKKEWLPKTNDEESVVTEYDLTENINVIKRNSEPDKLCFRGKISQYSSTGKEDGEYRRLLPVKLYQAIVYRQRLEDVLHRFTVRVKGEKDIFGDESYTDIPVNVHGTISGGLQLIDNAEVEVRGKYRSGILMATSIHIINNGHKSKVFFQRDVRTIMNSTIVTVLLLFLLYVAANSNGNFIDSLMCLVKVWAVMAAIVTVGWLFMGLSRFGVMARMISGKRRHFPLLGILIISLALAFLFVNFFGSFAGFGGYVVAGFYSLIPIVVTVCVLIFVIKCFFV